jgi:hypothetical protein
MLIGCICCAGRPKNARTLRSTLTEAAWRSATHADSAAAAGPSQKKVRFEKVNKKARASKAPREPMTSADVEKRGLAEKPGEEYKLKVKTPKSADKPADLQALQRRGDLSSPLLWDVNCTNGAGNTVFKPPSDYEVEIGYNHGGYWKEFKLCLEDGTECPDKRTVGEYLKQQAGWPRSTVLGAHVRSPSGVVRAHMRRDAARGVQVGVPEDHFVIEAQYLSKTSRKEECQECHVGNKVGAVVFDDIDLDELVEPLKQAVGMRGVQKQRTAKVTLQTVWTETWPGQALAAAGEGANGGGEGAAVQGIAGGAAGGADAGAADDA